MLSYTDLFFREKLRIPVHHLQPFRRLGFPENPEAQIAARNFSSWGAVVGTALQAMPDSPVRINVLGALGRAQAQKSRDLPAMMVVAAATASLLALPGVHGFWQAANTGGQLTAQTAHVEEASLALQRLEAENKKFLETSEQVELALSLARERQRWPRLLEELRRHSPRRLWITSLQVLPPPELSSSPSGPGKLMDSYVPVIEIGGMFEAQSQDADAEAVSNFQKALQAGGVLRNVTVLERETPQYVDDKIDQVALRFRLKAEWPREAIPKASNPGAAK